MMLPAAAYAEMHVSTEPQQRVAVLEEFTGIYCTNCPDGHAVSAAIHNAQPSHFIPINFHAGNYANPRPGDPDYRTDFGEALNRYMAVSFFPAGSVNRVAYNNVKVLGRESWLKASRAIIEQTSPVNLWTEARYNASNRQLTIDVEGYFTSSVAEDVYLNVLILEDGIVGPQKGSNLGEANEYVHNHMFRDCVTPEWGEVLSVKQEGENFTKTYTYTVPQKIRGLDVNPQGLQVVVTASKGRDEIITAAACYPQCTSFVDVPAASVSLNRLGSSASYGYKFLDLNVTSRMLKPITSLTFATVRNYESTATEVTVECNIPRGETRLIEVPFEDFEFGSEMSRMSASLIKINGEEYNGESAVMSFQRPATYPKDLIFVINTDRNASDNRFLIRNSSGGIVKEFGPYSDGAPSEYREEFSMPETSGDEYYCLEVTDSWGDGMLNPGGTLSILNSESKSLAITLKIDGAGTRMFFGVKGSGENPEPSGDDPNKDGIDGVDADGLTLAFDRASRTIVADGVADVTVYSAEGRIVGRSTSLAGLPAGMYVAVARYESGATRTLKLVL